MAAITRIEAMEAPRLKLRYFRGGTDLTLAPTSEATTSHRSLHQFTNEDLDDATILREATERVIAAGADPTDRRFILAQMTISFGRYMGKTFSWLLENDVGWTVMVVASHQVRHFMLRIILTDENNALRTCNISQSDICIFQNNSPISKLNSIIT